MACLQLSLLGSPRVAIDDRRIHITRRKSLAILAVFAETADNQQRDTLATLFWPESTQEKARGALRRELSSLNRVVGDGWLDTDRDSVVLNEAADTRTDVHAFDEYLALASHPEATVEERENHLCAAIGLYRGDFMAGFTLPDCPDFDDWQFFQSEGYRSSFAAALGQIVDLLGQQKRWTEAVSHARWHLSLDPLHEIGHQKLMKLYALSGQRSAALRQYEACRRILEEELGVPPGRETAELAESIRHRHFPPGNGAPERQAPVDDEAGIQQPTPVETDVTVTITRDEIRVVTILAAGLSQTSDAHWEVPPDQSAALVDQLVDSVSNTSDQFDGVVGHLLTDGAVAIYGAMKAHEDDAERAARAALSVRSDMADRGIDVAIGIATGTGFVVSSGDDHAEARVMGGVMNLAARLQARADTGQILISDATYRQTRGILRTVPLSVSLRGHAEPVTVHQIVRARQVGTKSRGLEGIQAEFVGRDEELTRLRAVMVEAQGRPHLLFGLIRARYGHSVRIVQPVDGG